MITRPLTLSLLLLPAMLAPATNATAADQVAADQVAADQAAADQAAADQAAEPADVIVVVGAAGTDEYAAEFQQAAERWEQAARSAGARWQRIGTDDRDQDANSDDLTLLEQAIGELNRSSPAPLWLVMIGHGTAGPAGPRFNLRGPDLAATPLAQWLAPLNRPLVVVAGFSSSSPFLPPLSAPGRVVITATRSGTQQSYSRFAGQLAAAIGDPEADIDHDSEVSILEAFLAGSAAVGDFYQSQARLQTEQALLDDNGDGLGTAAEAFRGTRAVAQTKDATSQLDGDLAATLTLTPITRQLPFTPQELQQRQQLEHELRLLLRHRDNLPPQQYLDNAKQLLLPLAQLYRQARQRQSD